MKSAKNRLLDAIRGYRDAYGITGDDLIQVAVPGEEAWEEWIESQGMDGDPTAAVIALRIEGFGQFYTTVDAAINDLGQYFSSED